MKTFNGYTIEQIKNNFPLNMIEQHKEDYLKNVAEIMKNEEQGYNKELCESLRNSNFRLIMFYTNLPKN